MLQISAIVTYKYIIYYIQNNLALQFFFSKILKYLTHKVRMLKTEAINVYSKHKMLVVWAIAIGIY